MKQIILLSIVVLTCSSCATVFTGSKKRVTFDANINQGATLTIDGYKHHNITFPYTTKVKGGFDETLVQAESEGYKKTQLIIDKTFNAVSVINLMDIFGWGIDAATGAMMKPEYKFYEFVFEKEDGRNYIEK